MKVRVEPGKCLGYATCVLAAPEVFDLGEDGLVTLLAEEPSEDLRMAVRQAVRDCPTRTLAIDS